MLLSFVIPSYNDYRILETIKSIKKIEAPKDKIEIIVQDGGSKKDLLSKIKKVIGPNDKLFVENDYGIFDGINRGLKNTSGDMIATLGTDDRVFNLDYSRLLSKYLMGYNFIQYDIHYTDSDWNPIRFWKARKISFINYFLGFQHAHFGLICSPEIYESVGYFNTKNKVNADYEFFYSCILNKKIIKQDIIPEIFVQMKIGGNSSSNIRSILKANFLIFKFIITKNPLLLFGLFFKPFHKLYEFSIIKIKNS